MLLLHTSHWAALLHITFMTRRPSWNRAPFRAVTTPPAGNMSTSREDKSQGTDKEQVKDRQMETFKDAKERMERDSGGGGHGGKGKNKETNTVNYTCFCPWCECSNSVTTYKTCDSCRAKGATRGHMRYVFPYLFYPPFATLSSSD